MESTIGLMIQSICWVDQIIIYDDNSSDKTVDIINYFSSMTSYIGKIILIKSEIKKNIFSIGELQERNRLLKMIFDTYNFEYLVLIDGDELISKELQKHILSFDKDKYNKIALSCYHLFNTMSFLQFYENTWNNVFLIDPHVRVLSCLQLYEIGEWSSLKHPWIRYDIKTNCIDEPIHFHLKYMNDSAYLNSSLPFLPQKVDNENAKQYLRRFQKKIPSDIISILTKT